MLSEQRDSLLEGETGVFSLTFLSTSGYLIQDCVPNPCWMNFSSCSPGQTQTRVGSMDKYQSIHKLLPITEIECLHPFMMIGNYSCLWNLIRNKIVLHIHFSSTHSSLHFCKIFVLGRPFPFPSLSRSPMLIPFWAVNPHSAYSLFSTSHTADHLLLPQIFAPRIQPSLGCLIASLAPHLPDLSAVMTSKLNFPCPNLFSLVALNEIVFLISRMFIANVKRYNWILYTDLVPTLVVLIDFQWIP